MGEGYLWIQAGSGGGKEEQRERGTETGIYVIRYDLFTGIVVHYNYNLTT